MRAYSGREAGTRKSASGGPGRFHIITPVWGAKYVDLFLDLTLPTLLAPGNLPSLPADKCLYQIFTSSEDVDRLIQAPVFKRLDRLMQVSIRRIDGMPGGHPYSTMSACHERAMRTSKGIDAAFVFSPPDHVWADGAFRAMLRLLADGKRAVLVAALRMRAAEEPFEALKRHALGWQKSIIRIAPRNLVQTFMRYLHPLAIAHVCPLADAPYQGNRSPGSYYWDVDGQGLLVRCCHPHVMVVWPVVRGAPIATTFDHELVRLCCPDYRQVHVVTDSDEICAFEISDSLHHSLGWISWDTLDKTRVVEWMNEWTNLYHRACLKKRIYLHAREIDAEWHPVVASSDQLIDSYLAAYRKYHSRRLDHGEYLVGRSLRGHKATAGNRRNGSPLLSWLLAKIASIPTFAWRVPRWIAAQTYRAINAKLYTRTARIKDELEARIAHLERQLADQIAENKASALHLRRELQMRNSLAAPNAADLGEGRNGHERQLQTPRAFPASEDCIEAVA